ncbi:MAG: hypothetical protein GY829_13175 [Gammaproteobacteria bacterium]|nr:hypothetical protein [Gammaproteobacteria bacterium]
MKTNMTHTLLVAVSKEANKRGFNTELTYNHDEWVLYIFDKEDSILFDRNTKISDIEEWMES